jgi:hypothetical protein
MNVDFTLTASVVLAALAGGGGAWITMRVQAALTMQRARDAFDIARAVREDLAQFKIEATRGFASLAHLEKTEERLTAEIAKVVAALDGLRGDLMKLLHASSRRRQAGEEG